MIYCISLDFGAKKGKIVGFSRFVPATTLTVRSIPRPPPCKIYMRQKSQKAVKKKKKKKISQSTEWSQKMREIWWVARALSRPFARFASKISSPLPKISKPSPSAVMSSTSHGHSLSLSLSLLEYNFYVCIILYL